MTCIFFKAADDVIVIVVAVHRGNLQSGNGQRQVQMV
jgi:hypothetical protein